MRQENHLDARALVGSLQRLAIPSYFWVAGTTADRRQVLGTDAVGSADRSRSPSSTPPAGADETTGDETDWVHQITDAHAAGLKVLGYVKTGYTGKAAAAAKHEVDLYSTWYGRRWHLLR